MIVSYLGVTGTVVDGVFITESFPGGGHSCGPVRVEISRQNSNLNAVKARLAAEARRCGANAVRNFRYGQRAHSFWETQFTFKWDTESWFGEGEAVCY